MLSRLQPVHIDFVSSCSTVVFLSLVARIGQPFAFERRLRKKIKIQLKNVAKSRNTLRSNDIQCGQIVAKSGQDWPGRCQNWPQLATEWPTMAARGQAHCFR